MSLPTYYCYNICLKAITINISVSTPPIHIGPTQALCTSHSLYQIQVTGLDDTKSNKLSVTTNTSVAMTIHFSSLIITFLTFFLIICDTQQNVASVSAGSRFLSSIVSINLTHFFPAKCLRHSSVRILSPATSRTLSHCKLLALFQSSAGDLKDFLDCMARCMGPKGLPSFVRALKISEQLGRSKSCFMHFHPNLTLSTLMRG